MPYLRVSLANGHHWVLSRDEVIVPEGSLREMNPDEVGTHIAELLPLLEEFQQYLMTRHQRNSFESVEDFRAEAAANQLRLQRKQTRHSAANGIWQIDYEVYSVEDFGAMLDQDRWSHIFRPGERKVIEALVAHYESWQDAARAVGLSVSRVREIVRDSVRKYAQWQAAVDRSASN